VTAQRWAFITSQANAQVMVLRNTGTYICVGLADNFRVYC